MGVKFVTKWLTFESTKKAVPNSCLFVRLLVLMLSRMKMFFRNENKKERIGNEIFFIFNVFFRIGFGKRLTNGQIIQLSCILFHSNGHLKRKETNTAFLYPLHHTTNGHF
jgi:hypothetical protein